MTRSRKPDTNPFYWDAPPRKIDMKIVRPTYKAAEMTCAKFSNRDHLFLKETNMLRYANLLFGGLVRIKDIVVREIETCEILRKHPHPNICRYKGVDYNQHFEVTGLLFDRYDTNLRDFVLDQHHFDVRKCMRDIWEGLAHMHSLGLVHCDIKPCNILVNIAAQRFVVGDFDSTHRNGAPLEIKWGTEGWTPRAGQTDGRAAFEIDLYAFDMLKAWIKAKGNGNPVKGSRYMRTMEILERAKKQIEDQNERRRNVQSNLGAATEASRAQVYRAKVEVPRKMQLSVSSDAKRAEAKQIRRGDEMRLRFYG
ncbi:Serine/threonine kinase [Pyrenophora tritici-repentis]|nr:serine/threonine kinase [Pyrenophora tritici-repentis Pt-1C-BFP]KAA8625744.1 Serine/threonine kinase [Pyrenophora tritici-repentis]EDU40548.1 serine/threonine kinase [Pyrenophora tritici-repentis Pt-1C-BFP]KAF7577253.1 SPS1, Serine-threonine protein kinase [Pyrenophora tritici-repentis]KAI0584321.1 Serine/threonine kinase [Pyrenophora tritici-repentis]KAI0611730.1 Serine/threonine kinase [Pyrenophora tritici-repentis]